MDNLPVESAIKVYLYLSSLYQKPSTFILMSITFNFCRKYLSNKTSSIFSTHYFNNLFHFLYSQNDPPLVGLVTVITVRQVKTLSIHILTIIYLLQWGEISTVGLCEIICSIITANSDKGSYWGAYYNQSASCLLCQPGFYCPGNDFYYVSLYPQPLLEILYSIIPIIVPFLKKDFFPSSLSSLIYHPITYTPISRLMITA